MIKEAIEKIKEMTLESLDDFVEFHGLQYFHSQGTLRKIEPPSPKALSTQTLDGLLSWFNSPEGPITETPKETNRMCLPDSGGYFIQVENHTTVKLYLRKNKYEDRHKIMEARFGERSFPFGQYMIPEDFIIKVQTHFAETDAKKAVIDMSSKIRGTDVKTSEDNGIAQVITVVNGVGRLEDKETNPMIDLVPARTFAEAKQPESPFLFRVRKIENESTLALFEADTGAWKVQAVKNIVEYLRNHEIVKTRKISIVG